MIKSSPERISRIIANGILASFELVTEKSSVKIIELIQEHKYITISEISDELGITTRAIEK
jgi:hypothetical protein